MILMYPTVLNKRYDMHTLIVVIYDVNIWECNRMSCDDEWEWLFSKLMFVLKIDDGSKWENNYDLLSNSKYNLLFALEVSVQYIA